jgi:AmiR/NasT family two-component response regulator
MRGFGYDSAHVTTRASQAGVTKIVFKPFIVTQLLETLKFVILKAEQQNGNV